jgi:hypothetical protein
VGEGEGHGASIARGGWQQAAGGTCVSGGRSPPKRQSVMERPERVRRVTPPSTTMLNTQALQVPSHQVSCRRAPSGSPAHSDSYAGAACRAAAPAAAAAVAAAPGDTVPAKEENRRLRAGAPAALLLPAAAGTWAAKQRSIWGKPCALPSSVARWARPSLADAPWRKAITASRCRGDGIVAAVRQSLLRRLDRCGL